MPTLEYHATRLELEPLTRTIAFEREEDDLCISIVGGETPVPLESVELWYGADDGNRGDKAIASASLDVDVLELELTTRGKKIMKGHDRVRITIDVPDLDVELVSIAKVLRLLFESAPSKLRVGASEPAKTKVRERAEGTAKKSVRVDGAKALLTFLTDRNLIAVAEDVSIDLVARSLSPLLALKPESRAIQAVQEFLIDDSRIDEVFARDEVLRSVIKEFLD